MGFDTPISRNLLGQPRMEQRNCPCRPKRLIRPKVFGRLLQRPDDHHPSRADLALIMGTVPVGSARRTTAVGNEASSSAVSWATIIAGAFAALALTLAGTPGPAATLEPQCRHPGMGRCRSQLRVDSDQHLLIAMVPPR
jgi:hypothetical protein